MDFVVNNLISVIAASLAAALLLNRFFKKSVFVRIGLLWLINLLFVMVMVGVKYKYFDGNRVVNYLIAGLNIIVSVFCFYIASIKVVHPMANALHNLKELSEGNLDIAEETKYAHDRNDIGRLYLSIEKLKNKLIGLIQDINSNVGHLTNSGKKLNNVSNKLSQWATAQASSAEEVSASMEEMTGNIVQNTENAQLATNNAIETEQGVIDGVNAADDAMLYTRQINEKISIVSEIAFQTNILALNAAVEAARAGENGKGFAVVASEVRKLAERSATAAREIEAIVSTLKNASDKAGEKLNAVIPKVKNNFKLVKEIALASSEQSSGASQINNAIHQLNQITQNNVAASEEMSRSSQELNDQAEQLKVLVSYFKL